MRGHVKTLVLAMNGSEDTGCFSAAVTEENKTRGSREGAPKIQEKNHVAVVRGGIL